MPKPSKLDRLPRVEVDGRAALRAWLEANHARSDGVWLVTWKKGSGRPHLPWPDVVDELLCFGWVDSLPRKLDAQRTMLLCTPRKPTARWSQVNKDKVARLEREGRLAPAGRAAIARAQASGAWAALDQVSALVVPPDLAGALAAQGAARAHWDAFPPSARRGILEWIAAAKKPETRARRVAETARLAAVNQRANQWPRAQGPRRGPAR